MLEPDTTTTLEQRLPLSKDVVPSRTSSVAEDLVFTSKQKGEKLLITNTNVPDKQVLKMLLAMDVTTNDRLEQEFDLFRTATKEANRIFNCEEFGTATLFIHPFQSS